MMMILDKRKNTDFVRSFVDLLEDFETNLVDFIEAYFGGETWRDAFSQAHPYISPIHMYRS